MTLSETQENIIKELRRAWSKRPAQRFGQLLTNYIFEKDSPGITRLRVYYQWDEVTLKKFVELNNI